MSNHCLVIQDGAAGSVVSLLLEKCNHVSTDTAGRIGRQYLQLFVTIYESYSLV